MKLKDSVWIAPGKPAAVLAAPGYCGTWPSDRSADRIARAFLVAARKAGADGIELDATLCSPSVVKAAREQGMRVAALVASAEDAARAADAGIDIFHVNADHLAEDSLRENLLEYARCVLVSPPTREEDANARLRMPAPNAGLHEELAEAGVQVVPLHSHEKFVRGNNPSASENSENLFGCTFDDASVPSSTAGALAATFGASLIYQHLALARYFGEKDAAGFLSQKEFHEMVQNLRAAEKLLGRPTEPAPVRNRRELIAERNINRGEILKNDDVHSSERPVQGKMAKIAVGKGYAVFASELTATLAAILDFTNAHANEQGVRLLLDRLDSCETLDHLAAIVDDSVDDESIDLLKAAKVRLFAGRESWLESITEAADAHNADVIAVVPADNALADPAMIDRMAIQHVKSAADYTHCPDLPRGMHVTMMSRAALQRIDSFTSGMADADTVQKLLTNHRLFRSQEVILDPGERGGDLDVSWGDHNREMLNRIVQTGAESTAQIVERAAQHLHQARSHTEAREFCGYTFVTSSDEMTHTA